MMTRSMAKMEGKRKRKKDKERCIPTMVTRSRAKMEGKGKSKEEKERSCMPTMMTRSRAKMEEKQRYMRLKVQLLPGIPNNITVELICAMLPWETFHNLSSVSYAWKQAVQRRQILDARIGTRSADPLVIIGHSFDGVNNVISLYSLRDKACYTLPPISRAKKSIPRSCGFITLDGKIYILGGLITFSPGPRICTDEVYVLDLLGQWQWTKCASMREARYGFGCGVIDGKIYVCGGLSLDGYPSGSEVYDPKIDAWRSIQPMMSGRAFHGVGIIGGELVVYGGKCYYTRAEILEFVSRLGFSPGKSREEPVRHFEVYNPVQDTWRMLKEPLGTDLADNEVDHGFFMAEGKLHSMSRSDIFVYDLERNTRTRLCSHSYPGGGLELVQDLRLKTVIAIDGQLLGIAAGEDGLVRFLESRGGLYINDEDVVTWQKVPDFSLDWIYVCYPFMVPLRL